MAQVTRAGSAAGSTYPPADGTKHDEDERLFALFAAPAARRRWERVVDNIIATRGPGTGLGRLTFALVLTMIAIVATLLFEVAADAFVPLIALVPMMLVFGYTGIRAGVVATLTTAITLGVLVADPSFAVETRHGEDILLLVIFVPLAFIAGAVFDSARRVQRDATNLAQWQEHLRYEVEERERRWMAFAESIPAMVLVNDRHGTLEFANRVTQEYTGLTVEEIAATTDGGASYVAPNELDRMRRLWAETVSRGERLATEARFRSHTGEYRLHAIRTTPVRDEDGRIERWLTIGLDVQDRARAEDALATALGETERSRALLDAVMENSPEGIVVFDRECRYIRVNAAAAEINGLPPDAHIGKTVDEVLPDLESQWPIFERVLAGETVPDVEVMGETPAQPGVQRWWLASYYPIHAAGGVDGICILFREISEWKRAQAERDQLLAELQKASAAKDEFLGLVSHELKTPITTIVGNAQVLRGRAAAIAEDDRESALDDIAHEGQRLHTIIENMLVLSRLEQGQHVELEPVIVGRLVDTAIEQQRKYFGRRNITVEQAPQALALGEPTYVTQIVGNLLSNAQKYSPPEAPIDVVIRGDASHVYVHVLDRGDGFPEEEAEQLFAPFYRSPRTSALVKGVGVGLSVCKRLVEAQNGHMWARRREGGGADIGFALPAVEDE